MYKKQRGMGCCFIFPSDHLNFQNNNISDPKKDILSPQLPIKNIDRGKKYGANKKRDCEKNQGY